MSVRGDLKQISVVELHVYKSRGMNSLIPHEGVTWKIQCVCFVKIISGFKKSYFLKGYGNISDAYSFCV